MLGLQAGPRHTSTVGRTRATLVPISDKDLRRLRRHPKQPAHTWTRDICIGGDVDDRGRYLCELDAGRIEEPDLSGEFRLRLRFWSGSQQRSAMDVLDDDQLPSRSLMLEFTPDNQPTQRINLLRCNGPHDHPVTRPWQKRWKHAGYVGPHVHVATHWAMAHPRNVEPERVCLRAPRISTVRSAARFIQVHGRVETQQVLSMGAT